MTILTEGQHAGEFLVSEAPGARSRETITIGRSQTLVAGQVVALIPADTGAVTVGVPAFTGTGDGTCTLASPAYGTGVQEGTYIVRLLEGVHQGGNFQVIRPDGTIDGLAVAGTAYTGQVKFTLAEGSTDFSNAAQFTIAVAIANATNATTYVAFNQDGTEGSQIPGGILWDAVTTGSSADGSAVAIVRDAEVNGGDLVWSADIEAGDITTATTHLAALGIIVR